MQAILSLPEGIILSKTEEDLKAALAGEAQARAKYVKWAGAAKKEGHQAIAKIFEETAENEYEHAAMIMKLLDIAGTTEENLKSAFEGETYEWTEMYPNFAKDAKEEGNEAALEYFEHVIVSEKHHAKRYKLLLDRLKDGTLYRSDKEEVWFCTNCGYLHKGKEAPEECPNCKHAKGYFKRSCELDYGSVEV
ncbi:MAG: rubrerythrin family protein [Methanobacteriota archaeon]|nr:MAG: rubrerythrin family protein [Euryarchaeota archaeon]